MRTTTTTLRPGAPATPELDSSGLGPNAGCFQIPALPRAHSACGQASEVSTPPLRATTSFTTQAEGSDDAPPASKASGGATATLVGAVGAAATLVGAFFRTPAPGRVVAAASGADACAPSHAASDASVRDAGPPRLPPLRPLVLCSSRDAAVSAAGAPPTALAGWVLRCSAHGRQLCAAPLAPQEPVQLLLPACGLDGVALVEPVPPAEAPPHALGGAGGLAAALPSLFGVLALPPGGARPLLLLSDRLMAAELAGPLAALADSSPRGAAAADCILLLFGNALQTTEHAPPPRVLAAAAAVAMSRGWLRTADALLSRIAAGASAGFDDDDDDDALRCTDSAGGSLLHAAIRCGAPGAVALLTSHAGFRGGRGRFGGAGSIDLAGTTPAHLAAAAMARGNPMPALALAAADAAMPLAWLGARDAAGATPSATAGPGPATAVFSAAQAARLSAGSAAARAACLEAQAVEQWDARELQAEAGLIRLEGAAGDAAAVGRALLRAALRALRAAAAPSYDSGAEGARCSDVSGDDEADSGATVEEAAPAPSSEGVAEYRAPTMRVTPAGRVMAWALRRARAVLGHARRLGATARRIRRRGVTRIAAQSRTIQKHS